MGDKASCADRTLAPYLCSAYEPPVLSKSGEGDTATRGSRARSEAETPLPPGAMYPLLLIAHVTSVVMATTPQMSTTDLQTHTSQSETHVSHTSHGGLTLGTSTDHPTIVTMIVKKLTHQASSVHQSLETQTSEVQHPSPVSLTEPPKVITDPKVSERHSTASESLPLSPHRKTQATSERHSTASESLPLSPHRKTQATSGSVSVLELRIHIIDNIHRITCAWRGGPRGINYELVHVDTTVENITVHGDEAAMFNYNIPPGPIKLYCRARATSGETVTSKPMMIIADTTSSAPDKARPDGEDAGPRILISLNKILTSVTQPVQQLNTIIIGVCGPVSLLLLLFIFVTHFCNRRGHKADSTPPSSAV